MTKIPFTLGGETFPDYLFEGPNTITLYGWPDTMNWACINLGQYVTVRRGARTGQAYVYSVCSPRGGRPSFTIIVRWES